MDIEFKYSIYPEKEEIKRTFGKDINPEKYHRIGKFVLDDNDDTEYNGIIGYYDGDENVYLKTRDYDGKYPLKELPAIVMHSEKFSWKERLYNSDVEYFYPNFIYKISGIDEAYYVDAYISSQHYYRSGYTSYRINIIVINGEPYMALYELVGKTRRCDFTVNDENGEIGNQLESALRQKLKELT